jgi:hypothetical protein
MTLLFGFLRSLFIRREALMLENLALRQQLAAYKRACKCPRLQMRDRAFWVWLSKLWQKWPAALVIVKPETVIRWPRQGFMRYWRWKSRPKHCGRPIIPPEHIDYIRRTSGDNPSWGEDKINEELRVKFSVSHSSSTIGRCMTKRRPRRDGQMWRTFIHFIFLNASHVRRGAREFMEYYNHARPSQATHAIPDPYPELLNEPHSSGKLIALPVLGGVQHDYRLAA